MNSGDENQKESREPSQPLPVTPSFPARYARFGAFQVDLERGGFWRHEDRVNLHGKVYQALLVLLRRPGEVVTREEVRRQLWPDTLHVNFDANVNTTINKLRQALGDSPDNPVYVETIPRRGYCFLAQVEFSDYPKPSSSKTAGTRAQAASNVVPADEISPRVTYSLPIGLRIATLVLAGMVVGSILALAWVSYTRSHKPLKASRETAVACEPCRPTQCLYPPVSLS
jgi:DNA-binding winged helix-turn-helix (wHTH) protein